MSRTVGRIAPGRAVVCLITTDKELHELNRRFRGKNYPTDVLSFPSSPSPHGTLGEIAISLDRASEQAALRGHGIGDELRILILHGVLHLRGMNHETDSGEMARAERAWRKRLGLPSGLIERSKESAKGGARTRKQGDGILQPHSVLREQ